MATEGQHSYEATIHSSKITNTLLNGRNYVSWARSATMTLHSRDKFEFITEENAKPKAANPEKPTEEEKKQIKDWHCSDVTVMTWLTASMEPDIADIFMNSETSQQLWEEVKNMYGHQNNHSHVYRLLLEIQAEKKGNRTNTKYVASLTKKKNELKIYRPTTTDPIEIKKRADEDETYQYLAGLDESFENLRAQLLVSSVFPTYSAAVNMVQREESRRLTMGGPQAQIGEGHETQAFIAKTQNPNSSNRQNPSKKCTHYKKRVIIKIVAGS